jgi:hypothetical protein
MAAVFARNRTFSSNLGVEKGAELSLVDQHLRRFSRPTLSPESIDRLVYGLLAIL